MLLLPRLLTHFSFKSNLDTSQFSSSIVGALYKTDGVASIAYAVLLDVSKLKTYSPDTYESRRSSVGRLS